jgi:zinc protease
VAAVAPGSPNDVIDAQNSDDVPTASVETIRALYNRLYRPENMMVVIVGDVDASQMEALIRKRFADWRGAGPRPNRTRIPAFQPRRIMPISHSALAEGRTTAMITVTAPLPPPARTRTQQADAMLMDMLALRAVNYRLGLTQAAGPPGKYGSFIENGEQGPHRLIILWDDFAPGQWQPAVAGLKRTACELSAVGLSEQDWATAKRYVLQDLERRAADIPNVELAKDLSHALADDRHLIPPDEMVRHARAVLPTISASAFKAWWRRQWSAGVEHIRVESAELAQVENPDAAIRATIDKATRNASCKVRPH